MNKTFNIYCDESTHLLGDREPYLIISYIRTSYNQLKFHKQHIKLLRKKHNFFGEAKWSKISRSNYPFYSEMVDYFFSTELSFRAVVVKKGEIDKSRQDFNQSDFYWKMYYQLLIHKIDLDYNYNIYIDIKDTCSIKKLQYLQKLISNEPSNHKIKIQFIRSHESYLMQLTDVIMGAVNYRNRKLDKVIAKNQIVNKIQQATGMDLEHKTSKSEDKFNLFFIDLEKNATQSN